LLRKDLKSTHHSSTPNEEVNTETGLFLALHQQRKGTLRAAQYGTFKLFQAGHIPNQPKADKTDKQPVLVRK